MTDRWRGLEALDAVALNWIKSQGAYTRAMLDSIPPRAALAERIAAASASIAQVWSVQSYGGRLFWLEQVGGSPTARLMARDESGAPRVLFDPTTLGGGAAITYFQASRDGGRVGLKFAFNGDEDQRLIVVDAVTGAVVAGPLDRAVGYLSWSDDGKRLFIQRLQNTADPKLRRLNMTAQVWDLTSPPTDSLGVAGSTIPVAAPRRPRIILPPNSTMAFAVVTEGIGADLELWTAPIGRANALDAPWRLLATAADRITAVSAGGDDVYLLSHKDAPTFKVLHLKAGGSLTDAEVVVPANAGRVIDQIQLASDGLWVLTREGLYSKLLFAPRGGTPRSVALPTSGSIGELFADPDRTGVVVEMGGWTSPDAIYAAKSSDTPLIDLKLTPATTYDPSRYLARELQATAADGVRVPLTVVGRSGEAPRPHVVLLGGYGAYGQALTPGFDPRETPFLDEDGITATCHARGGGEFGEAWHLGGKGATKPNTWRDLIACGKTLIDRGITTPDKLFIASSSAGGIMVGRAMEEAPAMFAGVIDIAPVATMLRAETMPGGRANAPEFGSTADVDGFHNLLAMDSVAHVEHGVNYPAVMIVTDLNDPRVPPWQGAKLAAALMDSDTKRPVLMRVEGEGGHDVGASKTHDDELQADIDAFMFWRAGKPGWAPSGR